MNYMSMYLYIPDLKKSMGKMDYSARKHNFIEVFNDICIKENKEVNAVICNTEKYIAYSKLHKALCSSLDKNNLTVGDIIVVSKVNKFSFNDMIRLLDTMLYGIPDDIKNQLEDEWEIEYTDDEYFDLLDYFKDYGRPNPSRITA